MLAFATILFALVWLAALAATFVPVVPATVVIWLAALLHAALTGFNPLSWTDLLVLGAIGAVALVADNVAAAWGARRFGGSRAAAWGALGGGLLFLFTPLGPLGFLIGPVVGAIAAELLVERRTLVDAARSGVGTLLGILGGIGVKLVVHAAMGAFVLWRVL